MRELSLGEDILVVTEVSIGSLIAKIMANNAVGKRVVQLGLNDTMRTVEVVPI